MKGWAVFWFSLSSLLCSSLSDSDDDNYAAKCLFYLRGGLRTSDSRHLDCESRTKRRCKDSNLFGHEMKWCICAKPPDCFSRKKSTSLSGWVRTSTVIQGYSYVVKYFFFCIFWIFLFENQYKFFASYRRKSSAAYSKILVNCQFFSDKFLTYFQNHFFLFQTFWIVSSISLEFGPSEKLDNV